MVKKILLLVALWAAFIVCGEAHGMEFKNMAAPDKVKYVRTTYYEPAHECFERFLVEYEKNFGMSRSPKDFYERMLPVVEKNLVTIEKLHKELSPIRDNDMSRVSSYFDTVGLYFDYSKALMESQLELAGKIAIYPDALDALKLEGYKLSNFKDLEYKEMHLYGLFSKGKGTFELTNENCLKIRPGMKYDEVVKLLKMPPNGFDFGSEKDAYFWALDEKGAAFDYFSVDMVKPGIKYLKVVFEADDNLEDIVVSREIVNL